MRRTLTLIVASLLMLVDTVNAENDVNIGKSNIKLESRWYIRLAITA